MLPTFKRVLYYQTDEFFLYSVFVDTAVFYDDGICCSFVGFGIRIEFLFDTLS